MKMCYANILWERKAKRGRTLKNQIIIEILIVFSMTFFQKKFNIRASLGENEVKITICSTLCKLHTDTLLPCQDINTF